MFLALASGLEAHHDQSASATHRRYLVGVPLYPDRTCRVDHGVEGVAT